MSCAELIPADDARLLLPGGEHRTLSVAEGCTPAELLSQVPAELHEFVVVFVNGTEVLDPAGFHLRAGDAVLLAVVPGGGGKSKGKGILGAVLTIAVAVFAAWAAPIVYSGTSAAMLAATKFAITMVGTMVVNALVKPPSVSTATATSANIGQAQSYSLQGQSNQPRPFGSCLVLYGTHKVMPAIANNVDVSNLGSQSVLSALYDFGLGWLAVRDIRIGDVPAETFHPEMRLHTNSLVQDLTLAGQNIGYDSYAITMRQNVPIVLRTKLQTIWAMLSIDFPKGLFQALQEGGQAPHTASFRAWWRPVGGSVWTEVPQDRYYGSDNNVPPPPASGLNYYVQNVIPLTPYVPGTAVADFTAVDAQWRASQGLANNFAQYNASMPTPNMAFQYTGGIDSNAYFARYPEIRNAGWTRGAIEHFEAVGSREGREPVGATMVRITAEWLGELIYNASTSPSLLHYWDKKLFYLEPLFGGWGWIASGGNITSSGAFVHAPVQFVPFGNFNWNEALYLARYPDVAAQIPQMFTNGYDHFTRAGAWQGRDPYEYTGPADQASVTVRASYVGVYHIGILFQWSYPGEWEVQVMRTDPIDDGTDATVRDTPYGKSVARYNESTVVLLKSATHGLPVQPRLRHTMLEMRVQASDQLQGVVQNLSAVCTSVLRVTADGVTFGYAETRNPAWIALDILTSERNPKPLSDAQIDWPSWIHLAQVCDTLRSYVVNGMPYTGPRYTCDTVVDQFLTVKDLVESVLSACRSSLVLTTNGRWGVLHDEEKTVPRQLITPANSWGFSGTRSFPQLPHALRVAFVNRDNAWTRDEVTVYADGYGATNASVFETLDTFGITDYPHAWAYGRYMLAQGIHRSELFTVSMDVENLLVQRGDLVYVAHDVPMVGGVPSRIDEIAGNHVHVNVAFSTAPTGYCVRTATGAIRSGPVHGPGQSSGWFVLDTTAGLATDDLIVLGEFATETLPYLVQAVTPGADLAAELVLCRYVPEIYQADQGLLPPWDPGFGKDYLTGTDLRSHSMTAVTLLRYIEREPRVELFLQWVTEGFGLSHHEVTVISGSNRRTLLDEHCIPVTFKKEFDALRQTQFFDQPLVFEAVPVSTAGWRGTPAYVTVTLLRDTTPPPEVLAFGANIQKEQIDLFWTPGDAPDIANYHLRYTPELANPSWDSSQHLALVAWPGTKTSAGARTGSYGIRVQDTSGNVSPITWRRTTISALPEVNVITMFNDRDLYPERWPGVKEHTVADDALLMNEGDFGSIYPDGIYYLYNTMDLGEVYELRVSSKIEAHGEMLNAAGEIVPALLPSWNSWLEVRTSDGGTVIADWPTMAEVDPIAAVFESEWGAWRPCMVGDYTARLMQFRIMLKSTNPGVRVVVTSGRVEVDMPDRVETFGNVQIPAGGLDFIFPVAYRHLEAVAVTIHASPLPLVAQVTDKSATGVRVTLRDMNTTEFQPGIVDLMTEGFGRVGITSI